MKNIDKLLIEAAKIIPALKFNVGFVSFENGKWMSVTRLQNGSREQDFISYHSTKDEAINELKELAVKYGNTDPAIIIDDIPGVISYEPSLNI
ncbi:MAG: hypothetical protein LKJ13_01830 [Clostridia bacterium]|jgi:hypothetical protein|nr:hypothetical protein [Clostridia bacterium]MCI1999018.1 hypothetical protein [Clostridia bacterium]MCI2013768.1 hypothetical protein [Clostridia bacterium]